MTGPFRIMLSGEPAAHFYVLHAFPHKIHHPNPLQIKDGDRPCKVVGLDELPLKFGDHRVVSDQSLQVHPASSECCQVGLCRNFEENRFSVLAAKMKIMGIISLNHFKHRMSLKQNVVDVVILSPLQGSFVPSLTLDRISFSGSKKANRKFFRGRRSRNPLKRIPACVWIESIIVVVPSRYIWLVTKCCRFVCRLMPVVWLVSLLPPSELANCCNHSALIVEFSLN
mmetsp:Transcript_3045/g.8272  ORF Transcript_3045/g.8272 Transcript_3045/m.8272 type:complete len:226 (-) Transcript_3045:595-1272(-)